MSGKRTDNNQRAIVSFIRNLGAGWIDMTQQRPSVGFDGLVLLHGRVYVCEIKNPVRWLYTPEERRTRCKYAEYGVRIWVLETELDVCDMLEAG